jgi:hypothetical protein
VICGLAGGAAKILTVWQVKLMRECRVTETTWFVDYVFGDFEVVSISPFLHKLDRTTGKSVCENEAILNEKEQYIQSPDSGSNPTAFEDFCLKTGYQFGSLNTDPPAEVVPDHIA